jgi:hypothetical protein
MMHRSPSRSAGQLLLLSYGVGKGLLLHLSFGLLLLYWYPCATL